MPLDREKLADAFKGMDDGLGAMHLANVAIAAIHAQGYRIVPVEPTEAMLEAGSVQGEYECDCDVCRQFAGKAWQAMLTAHEQEQEGR